MNIDLLYRGSRFEIRPTLYRCDVAVTHARTGSKSDRPHRVTSRCTFGSRSVKDRLLIISCGLCRCFPDSDNANHARRAARSERVSSRYRVKNRAGVGAKTLAAGPPDVRSPRPQWRVRVLVVPRRSGFADLGRSGDCRSTDSTERNHGCRERAKNTQCNGHDPQRIFEQLQVTLVFDDRGVICGGL
jgi:hypothetical protein